MDDAASRKEAQRKLLCQEGLLDDIVEYVTNGGTVTDWCELKDVRYPAVMRWIRSKDHPDRLKAYQGAQEDRKEWAVQRVLAELKHLATVDISEAYEKDGTLKNARDMPAAISRCIVAMESEEIFEGRGEDRIWIGNARKVKFHDKLKALELMGKTMAMFSDKIEHTAADSLAELINKSTKPAAPADEPTPAKRLGLVN